MIKLEQKVEELRCTGKKYVFHGKGMLKRKEKKEKKRDKKKINKYNIKIWSARGK